jgi:dihydroceramidase
MPLPFAWPYPEEQENGFWGIPTSTIDWCEENYVVSTYIAEALNTTTNAVFILLAFFAVVQAHKNHLEPRFVLASLGFLLVGVGSWWFHMTLRYEYQLLDELPMIYATCIPFWSVFSEFKSKTVSVLIALGIFMLANTLSFIYLYVYTNPTLHQTAYGALNVAIIWKSLLLTNRHVHDKAARTKLHYIMVLGVGLFIFGYLLWNLDIHFCDLARTTRRQWGIPYGFLLEGHGWWHIFTGSGVYFYIVYEEYLRCFLQGTQDFYEFKSVWGLPIVHLKDEEGLLRFREVKKLAILDEKVKKEQ